MNIDRKRPERRLKKLIANIREGLRRQEQDDDIGECRRYLADAIASDLPRITWPLGALGSHFGRRGCVHVLDGDAGGFAEIDLACLYDFWAYRIDAAAYGHDAHKSSSLGRQLATCWMHAEAIGTRGIRVWLDSLVSRVDAGYEGVYRGDMSPLSTLMAHFVTGKGGAALEGAGWPPLGVYQPIADGTFDSSQWDTLADWHLDNVDRGEYPPFRNSPYRLIPFELMAISRRTGIPISGEHPLLHTPLAVMREVPEIPVPDELQSVIDCARRVYGEV